MTTHVLVAGSFRLTTGSGGPKRQPAPVQLRSLPVSSAVAPMAVSDVPLQQTLAMLRPACGTEFGSGTAFPEPPK